MGFEPIITRGENPVSLPQDPGSLYPAPENRTQHDQFIRLAPSTRGTVQVIGLHCEDILVGEAQPIDVDRPLVPAGEYAAEHGAVRIHDDPDCLTDMELVIDQLRPSL